MKDKYEGYTICTVAYIFLILVCMIKISPLWFLGLFLWHWKWIKHD